MNFLYAVLAAWLLFVSIGPRLSEQFEPRGIELLTNDSSSTSLSFMWEPDLYDNAMYKVWYWPANTSLSSEVTMTTVYENRVTLEPLLPGEMYTVWLFGMMDGNVTSDYVTFQHRTGDKGDTFV